VEYPGEKAGKFPVFHGRWRMRNLFHWPCRAGVGLFAALSLLITPDSRALPPVGRENPRRGDEIVAAGRFFHTGTRVVTWLDPGGYDAYRVERRFAPFEQSDWRTSLAEVKDLDSPNRYNLRKEGLTPEEIERVRGGGWDLATLRRTVDQFVLHYDVCGTSRQCFKVLHYVRCLSVHFLLDVDGTVYQTLDLKERAWHASAANGRSIGIEIANLGAYAGDEQNPFDEWYSQTNGKTILTIPERFGDGGVLTKNFSGRPARPEPVTGEVQGRELAQYDFTPEQYEALTRLTATLCSIFPKLKCDYPRNPAGGVIPHALTATELASFQGVLGHYHVTTNKVDPGPAFQWERVIGGARRLLRGGMSPAAHATSKGHLK
jgi:N-acetyl-anhydromuramyl-L-alanine amidase AmpD